MKILIDTLCYCGSILPVKPQEDALEDKIERINPYYTRNNSNIIYYWCFYHIIAMDLGTYGDVKL
jgi:hypothetical protein